MRIAGAGDMTRWAAFVSLCAMLAPRADEPIPLLTEQGWGLIVQLASEHLVSPALWRAVVGDSKAPDEVKAYFTSIHEMNAARNRMILEGTAGVDGAVR